ncbi:hypothetical protein [Mesorhizobium sp. M1252]|uniref:hypothetical protein n=1 Tax=Mesorhizobium sp. M1252 TaxID=2957073 RepID=UPI00333AE0B4
MRRVDRSESAPADLLEKGSAELIKAIAHYDAIPPSKEGYEFAVYKLRSVKDALEKMFHGKCAYCETFYASAQPLDVEHFRPKGAVAEAVSHRGYWWLAMDWANLLPSCIDCNRKRYQVTPKGDTSQVRLLRETMNFSSSVTIGSGKKDSFPLAPAGVRANTRTDVLDGEKALLLNPCEDLPDEHLVYFFDATRTVSFILAKKLNEGAEYAGADGLSLKGATSVHVYGLNRLRLVQARTEVLRRLEFLSGLAIDLKNLADELKQSADGKLKRVGAQLDGFGDAIISELLHMGDRDQPYSAMVNAWLVKFRSELEQIA